MSQGASVGLPPRCHYLHRLARICSRVIAESNPTQIGFRAKALKLWRLAPFDLDNPRW